MSTLEQLTLEREATRAALLESPSQLEIVALRNQIISAKQANDVARVEALTQLRAQLKAKRDASLEELNHTIKRAKREYRGQQVAAAARALEGLSDSELGNLTEKLRIQLAQGRAELRAAVHEVQARARRKEIKALLNELSEDERRAQINALLSELSEEERQKFLAGVS